MITVTKIDSLAGIQDLVFEQTYNAEIGRNRSSYIYRGMPDASYRLVSSLQKNCKALYSKLEMPLLDNFIKYVRIENPDISESIWKAMVIGQHYGLPTRLLDWTHSILIALHFANTEDDLNMIARRDCAVWRIDMRELNDNLPEKYLSVLRKKSSIIYTLDDLASVAESIQRYDEDMGDRSMVCFEPPSVDQRIANQYSFFSVVPSGIADIESYLDANTEHTVKYVIDKSLRWEMRDLLDQFNINERMIYPGRAGIAKWLARHYFVQ